MIRAVLDTNTIASGVGWGGPPAAVLDAALAGHFEIVTSPALALAAIMVAPTETVELVRDPDDNRLIEAALGASADVIVTGDKDLLTLGEVGQISILTPREFLETLQLSSRLPSPRAKQLWAEAEPTAPDHNHGFGAERSGERVRR